MKTLSLVQSLIRTLKFVRSRGAKQIALCYLEQMPKGIHALLRVSNLGVVGLIQANGQAMAKVPLGHLPVVAPDQLSTLGPLDAIIIIDEANFAWILRLIETTIQTVSLVLPANPHWIVPEALKNLTVATAWRESVPVEYVARSGLSGHYLEFGTFYGRSFFPAYFRFRHWLNGQFYAFDSFQGLPKPQEQETINTGGDFREHTYCFGLTSFLALADLLGVEQDRLTVIPGFYSETLVGINPAKYRLEPRSVSVCVIDCDLYESTAQVLEFITPLLATGCLIYFDDWRLCRASRTVGERAAALEWLQANPNFELVEVYQEHWQHQWFIFNN